MVVEIKNNEFLIKVEPDGKIKLSNPHGNNKETYEWLKGLLIKALNEKK